jgi:coenzyme F420 hydrogenase subunit beta
MISKQIRTVKGIVDWRLCLGCGACAYICPDRKISLSDFPDHGIRPVVANEVCANCTACLDVCPGHENDHTGLLLRPGIDPALIRTFGPVLEIWEGYATDEEIRHRGASGGLITALALYCLDQEQMHGVLHTGGDPTDPVRNLTRMSRSRRELLECTGSRYSPASVCDGLQQIESATGPCAFIGQPAEVTALRKAQALRPELSKKVGIAISFFCAGSPSTSGTLDLLRSRGYDPADVAEIRYRGLGWPGMFAVRRRGEKQLTPLMTYQESWGFLQRYRPYAVHTCPDSSGEDADISCADPWYREIRPGEPGFSLVVVRTERGRELLRRAQAAGSVELKPANAAKVLNSQSNLAFKRGAIWGRIAAMRLLGVPTPRLRGFALFRNWLASPLSAKLKSVFGTGRRIIQRGYRKPLQMASSSAAGPITNGRAPARRICIMGASMATGNRGVSALGASLVKLISTANPESRITFLAGLRQPAVFRIWTGDASHDASVVNYRMAPKGPLGHQLWLILVISWGYRYIPSKRFRRWIAQRSPWVQAVIEADLVGDIRGGDSFSDIYGLRRFVVGCLPSLSVIWLRGSIVLFPQTHGPFKSMIGRALARYILRRSDPIFSRDRESAQSVAALLNKNARVRCTPDVAFALPGRSPHLIRAEPALNGICKNDLVGINVNGLMYNGGYTRSNMFGLKLDYQQCLRELVKALLRDPDRHLLLVPHTFAPPERVESDPGACARLRDQLPEELQQRVHLIKGEYDQHEIKWVIGLCSFFIGSRMHACIAALSQGIPAVGIAYSKKFSGVFESVGAEDWVIDCRNSTVNEAVEKVLRLLEARRALETELSSRLDKAKRQLHESFKDLLAC